MYQVKVIDWSDSAYKEYGSSHVVEQVTVDEVPHISYDGGRVDISGHPHTIWVMGHQFSIEIEKL
jgi:hypothetical protein